MGNEIHCPKCKSENIYQDGTLWVCPECFHEWSSLSSLADTNDIEETSDQNVRDANGNILLSGDSVTVIKELKIKGSTSSVKVGTKVKNIRLIDTNDGHNIACKIDGLGSINLKSEFVRKA
jgi:protein PhnA